MKDSEDVGELVSEMHKSFNALMDVEKHYLRKENLLFPYLEKTLGHRSINCHVGKHNEARELMKNAFEALAAAQKITARRSEDCCRTGS